MIRLLLRVFVTSLTLLTVQLLLQLVHRQRMATRNDAFTKELILSLLTNAVREGHGRRYSAAVLDFFTFIRLKSATVSRALSANLPVPSFATLERSIRRHRPAVRLGDPDAYMSQAIAILEKRMRSAGVRPGECPVTISIDETGIIAKLLVRQNRIIGVCGKRKTDGSCDCEAQEVLLPEDLETNVKYVDGEKYLLELLSGYNLASCTSVVTHYAHLLANSSFGFTVSRVSDVSVALLCPVVKGVPPVLVGIRGTCNKFTSAHKKVNFQKICQSFADAGGIMKVGKVLGMASDGDSRRVGFMLEGIMTKSPSLIEGTSYKAISREDSFVFCGNTTRDVLHLHVQDPFQYVTYSCVRCKPVCDCVK